MNKYLFVFSLLVNWHANAANLLVNGSFENYAVNAGNYAHVSTNGLCASGAPCIAYNSINGWSAGTGSPNEFLEIRNNFYGLAQDGNNFAELNPVSKSGITQTFTAAEGLGLLTWFNKGRDSNFSYSVFLNDVNIFTGQTQSRSTWSSQVFDVDLLAGLNTLRFVSNSITDQGAQIDNISIIQTTAVPEPETYGMMLAGLAMLGFSVRRRKS
jgi:hypothetical protein